MQFSQEQLRIICCSPEEINARRWKKELLRCFFPFFHGQVVVLLVTVLCVSSSPGQPSDWRLLSAATGETGDMRETCSQLNLDLHWEPTEQLGAAAMVEEQP